MFEPLNPGSPEELRKMRENIRATISPGQVDQMVRYGLQFCWMMLPENMRTADDVEREFRRIVDRALRDYQEDAARFLGKPPTG